MFLIHLWSSYHQTWHDGTPGQNLLKSVKILLTSSLWGKYDNIKQFLVSFQVELPYLLSNLAEIWHRDPLCGADFEFDLKNSDMNTFWAKKGHFLQKTKNFTQVLLDKSVVMATV